MLRRHVGDPRDKRVRDDAQKVGTSRVPVTLFDQVREISRPKLGQGLHVTVEVGPPVKVDAEAIRVVEELDPGGGICSGRGVP